MPLDKKHIQTGQYRTGEWSDRAARFSETYSSGVSRGVNKAPITATAINSATERGQSRQHTSLSQQLQEKQPAHSTHPCINTVQAQLLQNYIPILVNNHSTHALVDSGADISVANVSVLNKYKLDLKVFQSDKRGIQLANSEFFPIKGMIRVPFKGNNENLTCKFYLLDNISPEFIFGMDWLSSNNVTVNFAKKRMYIDSKHQMTAAENTTIPPHTEQLILAHIKGTSLPHGVLGTTTPSPVIHSSGLLSAKVLAAVNKGSVIQRVANMSEKPVQLLKGTCLGKFNCINGRDGIYPMNDVPENKIEDETPTQTKHPINIDSSHLSSDQSSAIKELVDNYSDIFVNKNNQLGKCDLIKHQIKVDPDQPPIRQRAYRISPQQKDILDQKLEEMLEADIIEGSTSPWAAPCLLVAKANNTGYRFVVDYRRINQITQLDAHPLPTPSESLESLGVTNPAWFSTLDLQNGFFQLVIDEESRPYTAFRCHAGLYQFKRLPMGLKGSPSTFQRVMEAVMRGLTWKFCLIYLDDIIVFSRTFEDHLHHLRQVFDRLRTANLKLKPSKCFFAKREIRYLGHVVNQQGIQPDPGKVTAVKNYPTPCSLKELRSFLGLSGYYRRFIKNYAKIANPLYGLTKKDTIFNWSTECQQSFDALKTSLTEAPVLAYPNMNAPFRLYTDASDFAVGGVLCQEQDGIERVISYAGRSLDKAQRNYGITEKECLALIFSIKHFDCYLRSTKFTAVVDHIALKWLKDIKQPTGRLWRWTILLQAYDFEIEYKPGRLHANADAISRRTYPEPTDEDNNFLYNITLHSDAGHDNVHDNDVSDPESDDDVDDTSGDEIETDIHVDMKNWLLYRLMTLIFVTSSPIYNQGIFLLIQLVEGIS